MDEALNYEDVKELAGSIECLECGQIGPCMECDHTGYTGDDAPCTCLGCNTAARASWIVGGLRYGTKTEAEVSRDDIYDLLVLARCDATGKNCTERVATDTCPACDCKTCRAFARVDAWLYEGRGGVMSDERRAG